MTEPKKTKKKSLPHTGAVQRDRSKRATGMPPDEVLVEQMETVVHPGVYGQMDLYRAMGLRARILTLPVMVAFVLGLLWRQIGSVREAVRVLHDEGMLWIEPIEGVSVQALLTRMSRLPAELFYRVLMDCLPAMHTRAQERQRPGPRAVAWAQQHFHTIWAFDGSTLDGLLKKCGLLQGQTGVVLAGKIGTLLDVVTQLPAHIWYEAHSQAHDHTFWPQVLAVVSTGCLLLLDKGYTATGHLDFAEQVGVEEDGRAVVAGCADHVAYQQAPEGVEARSWFVQEDQFGARQQGHSQPDALEHAFGECSQRFVCRIAQPDPFDQVGDTSGAGGSGHAVKLSVQVEELVSTHPLVEAEVLRQEDNASARGGDVNGPAQY
jgi:hypothetical protein